MADDLIELGLEGFDFVTDRYFDNVHEGVAKVGPWIRQQRQRSRGGNETAKVELTTAKGAAAMIGGKADFDAESRKGNNDDRGRGRGNGQRRDGDRKRSSPTIRVTDADVDYTRNKDHIYPPAPKPTALPYPTTGGTGPRNAQLLPMPPDGGYQMQRSASTYARDRPVRRDDYYSSEDESDYDRRRRRRHQHGSDSRRAHSEYGPRSRSQNRGKYDERKGVEKAHLAATLTGAVAGGFLGREASKGDMMATVAGALAGALGANVAEREWERHKRRDDKQEIRWEEKWGYRG